MLHHRACSMFRPIESRYSKESSKVAKEHPRRVFYQLSFIVFGRSNAIVTVASTAQRAPFFLHRYVLVSYPHSITYTLFFVRTWKN